MPFNNCNYNNYICGIRSLMTSKIGSLPLAIKAMLLATMEALKDIEAFKEVPPSFEDDKMIHLECLTSLDVEGAMLLEPDKIATSKLDPYYLHCEKP